MRAASRPLPTTLPAVERPLHNLNDGVENDMYVLILLLRHLWLAFWNRDFKLKSIRSIGGIDENI